MARARCRIEAVLLEFLTKRGLGPSVEIAVAYSGGPDSTALLAALSAVAPRRAIAVHVDHGIRGREELQEELALVAATCSFLHARLLVAHVRPGAVLERSRDGGGGVEAAARRFRYSAFRSALKRTGAEALLLAHTLDDQLETILMRLLGGSGAGGLKGIPETSGPFLRPFLGVEKAALLSYLEERRIAFSTDSTNSSDRFTRNRIRRELVPILDSGFPGWRRGLARVALKAAMDEDALAHEAEALAFLPSPFAPGELAAPRAPLLAAPHAVSSRAIVRAAGRLLAKGRFPSGMAAAALSALGRGQDAAYEGAGLVIRSRGDRVLLRRGLDFPRRGGYFVLIDRPRRVRVGSLVVSAAWSSDASSGIRADAFSFPIVVRSRRPGDAIAFEDGTKRLDALFSEWAMPEDARGAAPVIEDRDGIVAVLCAGLGGRDRFRAHPKGERSKSEGPEGKGARRLSVIVKGA
jgi:tRNA(Ile)-lysidine synthase